MSYLDERRAYIEAGRPLRIKEKKPIAKVSEKRKQKLKELSNSNNSQDQWYNDRRKELVGRCVFCNESTTKNSDTLWRIAIAHIFEKRKNKFPSVACHKDNYLELCMQCHRNFDDGIITWQLLKDSKEWEMIMGKVKRIYPYILESEKKNIPEILLKELENN